MRSKTSNRLTKVGNIGFEELYSQISEAWEQRAKELQARRWQKLQRKMKAEVPK